MSTSSDGINWTRKNDISIIAPSIVSFDSEATYKPTAVYDKERDRWLLWYNGRTEEKNILV